MSQERNAASKSPSNQAITRPKLFVIILNYNGADVLKNCLASLYNTAYPNMEVVIVDNNSSDGSLEEAKRNYFKAAIIKNDQNIGFSAGNNVGIKYALEKGAQYVLLLNNDTVVCPDFLERLIKTAQEHPRAGILSPLVLEGGSAEIWFAGGRINWLRMRTVHIKKVKSPLPYKTGYISGCAMLARAEVFKKIGLLDEDYFLYCEDADFSTRAKRAGFDLLMVPDSKIRHFERSEQKKKDKTYWLVISGLIFFKKNTPLWISPWISLYTGARRLKNYIDVRWKRNDLAPTVRKAYGDLKYLK